MCGDLRTDSIVLSAMVSDSTVTCNTVVSASRERGEQLLHGFKISCYVT